eukprot:TRINITY_DN76999_c0_g1_i1.p1 TRINITY_DN76999_c0_g1~~TRINITY_DN76999_c0_g1_i1.p1  ORF type:complete len:389 (-),score=70.92 TRINITY_DN76999_c0_g1_i1:126-1184(-)
MASVGTSASLAPFRPSPPVQVGVGLGQREPPRVLSPLSSISPTTGSMVAVKEQPKDEADVKQALQQPQHVPLTISSEAGGGTKSEVNERIGGVGGGASNTSPCGFGGGAKAEVGDASKVDTKVMLANTDRRPQRPVTVASSGGGAADGRTTWNLDTQASQTKSEPKTELAPAAGGIPNGARAQPAAPAPSSDSSQIRAVLMAKTESKEALANMAAAEVRPLEPQVHPTGVWLGMLRSPSLKMATKREFVKIDGVDMPQAQWTPGKVEIIVPNSRGQAAAASACSQATRGAASRTHRRSFKLFRKSDGQLPPARRQPTVVPVSPWAPAAGPLLSEAFCSQPMDSQSQLPPINM